MTKSSPGTSNSKGERRSRTARPKPTLGPGASESEVVDLVSADSRLPIAAEPHRWSHHICWDCWLEMPGHDTPAGIVLPVRIPDSNRETVACCFCGNANRSGIRIRHEPSAGLWCERARREGLSHDEVPPR